MKFTILSITLYFLISLFGVYGRSMAIFQTFDRAVTSASDINDYASAKVTASDAAAAAADVIAAVASTNVNIAAVDVAAHPMSSTGFEVY
eukprot:CFRG7058T1